MPKPMKLLFYLQGMRDRLGGGTIAQLRLARALEERGHQIQFTSDRPKKSARGYTIERMNGTHWAWADLFMCSAYSNAAPERERAVKAKVPTVAFLHSAMGNDMGCKASLIVYASGALEARMTEQRFVPSVPSLVCWPIVPDNMSIAKGTRVTLINLQEGKGVHVFWELAKARPDVRFLAVKGGWGKQIIPDDVPPNVLLMEYQQDAREVYRETGTLLFLRSPEWNPDWMNGVGLTALEAAQSGIPTIYHDGPGLRESVGNYGTSVKAPGVKHLSHALTQVLAHYDECSYRARMLWDAVRRRDDMDRLEVALMEMVP